METLIADCGLEQYRKYPVSSYSGGVKRRLDIALNMMTNPKILFLDEPTVGKDIQSRQALSTLVGMFLVISQIVIWNAYQQTAPPLLARCLLLTVGILDIYSRYFYKQNKIIEAATEQMNYFLAGNTNARIACDDEGELYKLLHVVKR